MDSDGSQRKCSCIECAGRLEYPVELEGSTITCPHCAQPTKLEAEENPFEPEALETRTPPLLTVNDVLGAFHSTTVPPGTSFLYLIGLLLVAGAVVVLPLIYIGLLGLAAYGVYWWGTGYTFLLSGSSFGFYVLFIKWLLYFTPLFAGATIVFFMIKPLLAGRVEQTHPLALNPGCEPLLFTFVGEICKRVGAPFPTRIDVDCEINAAASLRQGFGSFFSNDLVLTLGLPLVAGCSANQLAGIIAHEFGHFTQGVAMRLSYVIRRVNHWFARVIYQRDKWDLMLEQWALDEEDWKVQVIVATARLGVWFSRLILKGLMYTGIAISGFISRQKEYDADRHAMTIAGSEVFETTSIRLEVLDVVSQVAHQHLRQTLNTAQTLPDNLPAFLMEHDARMPEETRTAIADRAGLGETKVFSTHPATGDRIRCARRAAKSGIFFLDAPATQLFENFDGLSKQATLAHYADVWGLPLPLIKLQPAEHFFSRKEANEAAPDDPAAKEMKEKLGVVKLSLKKATAPSPAQEANYREPTGSNLRRKGN